MRPHFLKSTTFIITTSDLAIFPVVFGLLFLFSGGFFIGLPVLLIGLLGLYLRHQLGGLVYLRQTEPDAFKPVPKWLVPFPNAPLTVDELEQFAVSHLSKETRSKIRDIIDASGKLSRYDAVNAYFYDRMVAQPRIKDAQDSKRRALAIKRLTDE